MMFLSTKASQLLMQRSAMTYSRALALSSAKASSTPLFVSSMQANQKYFSTDNRAGGADEGSHDDFQPQSKGSSSAEVTEHISTWVNENDVCVFMKGTRKMP